MSREGKLIEVPISLRGANDFVAEHHRHSGRTSRNGGKFAIGATLNDEIVGVAIVGNPVSATLMDGMTAEVLRLCVLETSPPNTPSFLYGTCWRVWRAMGGIKMVTYTLQKESGASLRGAGWKILGEVKPHSRWEERKDHLFRISQEIYREPKYRWGIKTK